MYNFDEIIERRNTNALNTDGFRGYIFHAGPDKVFPFKDEEFVRMWVADMEFATPKPICDAMKDRIDKRIFGYTGMYDSEYYKSFSAWCMNKYGWSFPEEELCYTPGIIPALYQLGEDLVGKNEKAMTLTPAYGYFLHTAEYNRFPLVTSDLIKNEDGSYDIDFADFEKKASDPHMKLVIWCNPQNPTGRVWTVAELKKIAEIVEKYNLWIISDEIHCDLLRTGIKHVPMAKIMPSYPKLITCMSASKTFNMAGLMFSDIIIRDPEERARFRERDKVGGMLNPISIAAHKAAYDKCDQWLSELKTYLDGNFAFLKKTIDEELSGITFKIPDATYLAWVNFGAVMPGVTDLCDFFANKAGVLLEGGNSLFVGNAEGYVRLNLAMPRSIIETGMERIVNSVKKL